MTGSLARRRRLLRGLAGCAVLLLAGCGSAPSAAALGPVPATGGAGNPEVYAALGASETAGLGISDQPLRFRAAWPQLFFNEALTRASTYYNFAVPGITLKDANSVERSAALTVHPTVVSIFFGTNDIVQQVPPAEFEQYLTALIHAMRQGGSATVLVANIPPLGRLPAVLACLPDAAPDPPCALGDRQQVPSLAVINSTVDAYNAAITRVAREEGATVVDLHAQGDVLQANPEYVSPDGFHPSALGHAAIAQLFASALRARRG